MDFLQGKTLLHRGDDHVLADTAMAKKNLILYYFTADNCPPCRSFDGKLKEVYRESLLRKVEMAIIVVMKDDDRESMISSIKHYYGDWYALLHQDDLIEILKYNYGVTYLPNLVVVRRNGAVITKDGKTEIEAIGINVLVTWME